jgi:hypothetical protein
MSLVLFACAKCRHAGPISTGPLPRLATCSCCGGKALVPRLAGSKPHTAPDPTTTQGAAWLRFYGDELRHETQLRHVTQPEPRRQQMGMESNSIPFPHAHANCLMSGNTSERGPRGTAN